MTLHLGIRAHDIAKNDLEALVEEVKLKGFSAVQLAPSKSFKDLSSEQGALTSGLAHHIGTAFRNQNIQIAVLGCYINMIHPDQTERRKALNRFKETLRYARDFGCSIVGTETGSMLAQMGYTTENFRERAFQNVVESVRELVSEAEKFGVIVGIEGGINHPIYAPQVMKRLIDEIHSNHLQVIFDPANYITLENCKHHQEMVQEAFDLFGERIIILHAKDFVVEGDLIKMTAVGKGLMDYEFLLKYFKSKKPFIPVLIENTQEPFIDESADYLRQIYQHA
jgi:L-ribulose-5-phosphate 3-epimerase